jgi:hypothetical protein
MVSSEVEALDEDAGRIKHRDFGHSVENLSQQDFTEYQQNRDSNFVPDATSTPIRSLYKSSSQGLNIRGVDLGPLHSGGSLFANDDDDDDDAEPNFALPFELSPELDPLDYDSEKGFPDITLGHPIVLGLRSAFSDTGPDTDDDTGTDDDDVEGYFGAQLSQGPVPTDLFESTTNAILPEGFFDEDPNRLWPFVGCSEGYTFSEAEIQRLNDFGFDVDELRSPDLEIYQPAGVTDEDLVRIFANTGAEVGFKKGVNRATTQVLMKTGQVERTNDRDFETELRRFRTMESASNKLQKEAKGYLDSLRGE